MGSMNTSKYFNLEAEAEILGAVLKDNDSIINVIDHVKAENFYSEKHKIIYSEMIKLYEKSIPIDVISLSESLGSRLKEVGGVSYISEILGSSATSRNINAYAAIVVEKSRCRKVKELLNCGLNYIDEGGVESQQVIDDVENKLSSLSCCKDKEDGDIGKTLELVLNDLVDRYKNGGEIQGIKSSYKNLDKILGGFKKEDLIVLAARPSMGKTAMAINLALNTSMIDNAKVAFFNLEMGRKQLMERALSITTDIPMENIKNGQLTEDHWGTIIEKGNKIEGSALKIYDNLFSMNEIKTQCKKLKLQGGLDIVIIDYLQLINPEERSENRNQEISKISRKLKLMAKELEVTVIALAQLSRAPELRAEHRPLLSDLRESGSIEQDADIVMFLYRDEYYDKNTDCKNLLECIIAKHRNGGVGTIRLKWRGECQKIW